jgi:acyl carrier protein
MIGVAGEIHRFVVDNFLFGQDADPLGHQDSFLEKGVIDSTGVLELVTFLEKRFDIKVLDEELVPENLDSVQNLVRFVESKRGLVAQPA